MANLRNAYRQGSLSAGLISLTPHHTFQHSYSCLVICLSIAVHVSVFVYVYASKAKKKNKNLTQAGGFLRIPLTLSVRYFLIPGDVAA